MGMTPAARPPLEVFEGHHRGLVERLAALETALEACRRHHPAASDTQRFMSSLEALQRMAELHFADEEKLMDDVLFPDRHDHASRHREFLTLMAGMVAVASRGETLPGAPVEHLSAWWRDHALGPDRALTDFLCRGGI